MQDWTVFHMAGLPPDRDTEQRDLRTTPAFGKCGEASLSAGAGQPAECRSLRVGHVLNKATDFLLFFVFFLACACLPLSLAVGKAQVEVTSRKPPNEKHVRLRTSTPRLHGVSRATGTSVLDVHDHAAHPVRRLSRRASCIALEFSNSSIASMVGRDRDHLVNSDPVTSRHVGQTTSVGRTPEGVRYPAP